MQAHNHPEPTGPRGGPADVFLIVGLPGAGKTTRAKELEIAASALRLTPDEWQIAQFGNHDLLLDKRDVLEGKLTGASAPVRTGVWPDMADERGRPHAVAR